MDGYAMYANMQQQNNDEMIVANAPLVKKIAYHIHARLPDSVQIDDLIQAGMLGLLEAIGQFDPKHGASFSTYAGIRVRGAILDEIRRNDWTPRSVSRNLRDISGAIARVESSKSGPATSKEIASELGVSLEQYQKMTREASKARIFSLEEMEGENQRILDTLAEYTESPGQEFFNEGFKQKLAESIGKLPEREAMVMSLYYQEELNLREIGEVLEVSESRVSQIHGQAMARIRVTMKEWTED